MHCACQFSLFIAHTESETEGDRLSVKERNCCLAPNKCSALCFKMHCNRNEISRIIIAMHLPGFSRTISQCTNKHQKKKS